jgi:hypothetical protein
MVYAAANGFMPFATGTPLYPIRPMKVEVQGTTATGDWNKSTSQGIIPTAYGYSAGFVPSIPVDSQIRHAAYPFIMPGQYVAQMSYPQQVTN